MRHYSLFLVLVLLLAACAPPTPTPTPPPLAPLTVYADISAANVLRDIRTLFLQLHPEGGIELVFDKPEALRTHLASATVADVVLTMDAATFMDLQKQNRLAAPPRVAARDSLAVFVSAANPKGLDRIEDLNRGDLEIAIAQETTPLGSLTRALVENFRTDASFGPDFPQLLFTSIHGESDSGEQILNRVLQKQADVGIVFSSQADVQRERIRVLEITQGLNVTADYSAAVLTSTTDAKRAQGFMDFLFAPQAQTLWQDYGFELPQ